MSFLNKVVLVTGASSGIGAAAAIRFAKEGANVAIVGRNEAKLKKTAELCASAGSKPLVFRADVSNEKSAIKMINDTVDKFSKLDVLVNNAGVVREGVITGGKVMDTYDEVMNINLRSVVHLTSLAAPYLAETKGNIVNISSVYGICTPPAPFITYSISKAALAHFTKGAALELASAGVRVNAISPGPVRTDVYINAGIASDMSAWDQWNSKLPLQRVSMPEEIADLILYLASDKAKGITGSDFVTDNGGLLKLN